MILKPLAFGSPLMTGVISSTSSSPSRPRGLYNLLGVFFSPVIVAANTIIHNVSDNEMMGKIFSSMEIVMHLGFLIFMFISSIIAEKFSHGIILISVGCLIAILGVAGLIINRKIQWLN